jgi:chemotaxis protein methyltransferase CheR
MSDELPQLKDDEFHLLLQDLLAKYGYDFSNYSQASLKRRISRFMGIHTIPSFAELRFAVTTNREVFFNFMEELTVNVTEMFRDPTFFAALKQIVFPVFETLAHVRIWHAGCSTGEEVFSLSILLKEAGLSEKCIQYATDINSAVLEQARTGILPLAHAKMYSENYLQAGGSESLSDYYTARYNNIYLGEDIRKNIHFSKHNLVSDQSFNEFDLVICRNVMIYFNISLQNRVLKLFTESLCPTGFLALGSKETLKFSGEEDNYTVLSKQEKIWKKKLAI